MRKNTEGKGFGAALAIAACVSGFMLALALFMLVAYFGFGVLAEPFAMGVILFYAFVCIAIAVGVLVALYQRWKEIQGGEEDEAKKY